LAAFQENSNSSHDSRVNAVEMNSLYEDVIKDDTIDAIDVLMGEEGIELPWDLYPGQDAPTSLPSQAEFGGIKAEMGP